MANYFVDSTTGDDGDNGTTMDLAFATLEYAMESAGVTAGDRIWVRRIHAEAEPTSTIAGACHGTAQNPVYISGWPRNSDASITQADWTNGSTTVDNIVGLSMDREQHLGRYVTAPDGETYMITEVVDSNTVKILNEYVGSTVTGTDGACTIQADEDYTTAQAIDDSGWTITKATWNADADDIATIDMGNTNYDIRPGRFNFFSNLEFTDAGDQLFYAYNVVAVYFIGCIFSCGAGNADDRLIEAGYYSTILLDRCVLVGKGSDSGYQDGVFGSYYVHVRAKNTAIYSMGNSAIRAGHTSSVHLENINLGVEQQNYDYDLYLASSGRCWGRDVKMGGTAGEIFFNWAGPLAALSFENHNRVLGAHKEYRPQGDLTKTDVVAGSGDPEKRSGGADSVLEVLFNESDTTHEMPNAVDAFITMPILVHEFGATTDSKTYRYYVQAEGAVLATELYLVAEYVGVYDDTTEYIIKEIRSDEAISARADAGDWDNYLEVTVQPITASKVRIKCYCSYYHATNKIYIDPKVEISDA